MRPPEDAELVAALDLTAPVTSIVRAPYGYATSFAMEEVQVTLADGRVLDLLLKDLAWDRLLPEAAATKPLALYDPLREIDAYRRLLAPAGIGPPLAGARADGDGCWLLLAKVPGIELWQVGDPAVWQGVAAWLARFHGRFAGKLDEVRAAHPRLLELDRRSDTALLTRAREVLVASAHPLALDLVRALERGDAVVERLAGLTPAFVHGELYPSNVLVASGPPLRVWPVDWEMAAIGPPARDVAALTTGWEPDLRSAMLSAYAAACEHPLPLDELAAQVDLCSLQLALQWIGWSETWEPPAEHARDWVAEALAAATRLGL